MHYAMSLRLNCNLVQSAGATMRTSSEVKIQEHQIVTMNGMQVAVETGLVLVHFAGNLKVAQIMQNVCRNVQFNVRRINTASRVENSHVCRIASATSFTIAATHEVLRRWCWITFVWSTTGDEIGSIKLPRNWPSLSWISHRGKFRNSVVYCCRPATGNGNLCVR